ncbi:MAG: DUF885 domain-containing protein [Solobacterium sp.]|nr:DUF885 domain-containing protein [Solobacterium sp.]
MKRIIQVLCATLLVLTNLSFLEPLYAEEGNSEFDQFLTDEFLDSMEADYLTMHYTVKNYQNFDIEKPALIFGDASLQSYQDAIDENTRVLNELTAFDYNSLSEKQKVDYDVLKFYLENSIELNKHPMLDQVFNPYTGVLDSIVTNLSEFVFNDKEDIEDYLVVVKDTDVYLRDAVELTKQQASEGIFLSDALLNETLDYINKFTEKREDNALIQIFNGRMDDLEVLSEQERSDYKARNREVVLNTVIPAYEMVGRELESLRGSGKYEGGVINYPNGKEYYAALARMKSSTDASVEELADMCKEVLREAIDRYINYASDIDVMMSYYSESVNFETPEEVLTYLRDDLPEFPEGNSKNFISSYLDPSVTNENVVAYYMTPCIDDTENNVIRINGEAVEDINSLYETLAHEGYPGHLYQVTWYLNTKPHPIRSIVGSIGYTEGWAMYAMSYGWKISGVRADIAEMHMLDLLVGYIMDAWIDLGVNGLGWTIEDVERELEALDLNPENAQSLYDFVIGRPASILPYGIGMAQFFRLRGKAEEALGDAFDVVEFNRVLLENGDRPFEVVERDVDAYIKEKGKEIPTDYSYYDWYMKSIGTGGVSSTTNPFSSTEPNYKPKPLATMVSKPILYGIAGVSGLFALFILWRLRKHAKANPFKK